MDSAQVVGGMTEYENDVRDVLDIRTAEGGDDVCIETAAQLRTMLGYKSLRPLAEEKEVYVWDLLVEDRDPHEGDTALQEERIPMVRVQP